MTSTPRLRNLNRAALLSICPKPKRRFAGWHSFVIPTGTSSLSTRERTDRGNSKSVIPHMSVLVDKNTRLVVQGITGSAGAFHTRQCIDYGTNVVAGVTPGKGGQKFDDEVPVFDTVAEARRETGCNVSMIFVPAAGAAGPLLRNAGAGGVIMGWIFPRNSVEGQMGVESQKGRGKKPPVGAYSSGG